MTPPERREAELTALATLAQGRRVLELGTRFGESTFALARTAQEVWTVDHHRGDAHSGGGDSLPQFIRSYRAKPPGCPIVPLVGRFEVVLPQLRPASFGMVFLDGFHGYAQVQSDARAALPLLGWGGLFVAHDWGLFEVEQALISVLGSPDNLMYSLASWWHPPAHWRSAGAAPGESEGEG